MEENYLMNTYGRFNVTFEKGIGTKLYDTEGNEYLDFVSGIAVNCLGHCHPSITKAIEDQSNKLIHISNYYYNTTHTALSKKIIENSNHNSVFFCNSGTEAVEAAIKLARKYGYLNGGKSTILYMENSFHGRSLGALSVTGQEKYQEAFKPLLGGVKKIIFNDLQSLKENFTEDVCGVIIEPIQGEGGIINADINYLKELKSLCEQNNALLIFDEIQCGVGRLGTLFAYEKFGVIPDIITLAKGLGGGFPIGAIVANEKASSAFVPGDHGTTFGGNPLACAVSLAVLNELIDGNIISSIDEKSNYFFEKLEKLKSKFPVIKSIKGMGFLVGVEVDYDAKEVITKCFNKKLLLVNAGPKVIRFLPPLNVSTEDLDKSLEIFSSVMEEICQ